MYADDHKMFYFRNNQSSVTLELREIGRNVPYSYDSNLLAVNLKRYHAMNIGDSELRQNDVTHNLGEQVRNKNRRKA